MLLPPPTLFFLLPSLLPQSLLSGVRRVEATEEEEHDGCDGANPRCRLDDTHLSLADVILLRSIVAMTVGAAAMVMRCMMTATMSMPAIDVIAVHWAGGLGG